MAGHGLSNSTRRIHTTIQMSGVILSTGVEMPKCTRWFQMGSTCVALHIFHVVDQKKRRNCALLSYVKTHCTSCSQSAHCRLMETPNIYMRHMSDMCKSLSCVCLGVLQENKDAEKEWSQ
jgi:hypothetical protein